MNLQQAHEEHAARQAELDEVRANWSRHMQAYSEWVAEIKRGEQERYECRKKLKNQTKGGIHNDLC